MQYITLKPLSLSLHYGNTKIYQFGHEKNNTETFYEAGIYNVSV